MNRALREGLHRLEEPPEVPRYRVRTVSLGKPRIPNLDNIGEILSSIEGEAYR